jgi:hypothetical protein
MSRKSRDLEEEEKTSNDGSLAGQNSRDVEKGGPRPADASQDNQQGDLPWYKQRKLSSAKSDPFGDEEGSDVKYKTMAWWQAYMVMTAETVSLGILSLPSVLASVGMVAGIILIAGLGLLATYVMGSKGTNVDYSDV